MGLVLGIDQGIASVGWGIIDTDNNKIVDAGVRLFPEANKKDNESRRSFRGSRRLKRRKATRREDLKKTLLKAGLYRDNYFAYNPYICRVKGLNEKLSNEELCCAIFNIAKHRGSSLETVEDASDADEMSMKYNLSENDKIAELGKYVCEIQLERIQSCGKVRGNSNNFHSSLYEKELNRILSNQELDKELIDNIFGIIFRRRSFSDGPGSYKSQTPYGRVYNEDGTVKVGMIEKMTGHCSVYTDELRAPKLAPSAELFNLLNDLNNLRIEDEPLEISKKQELVKIAISKGSITPLQIAKFLEVDLDEFTGFRIDKNQKQLITDFKGLKKFKKIYKAHGKEITFNDFKNLDNYAKIITDTKVLDERIKLLIENGCEEQISIELAQLTEFSGTHSLSLKAIYDINEEMINSQYNQMQILHLSNKFEFRRNRFSQKGKKKIAINDEAILSPVALRSYRQAVKVINAARAKYGEFDSIVVETTRDKNSDEQKRRIAENQKFLENRNKQVQEVMKNYPHIKLNSKLREKILLYEEQNCKTAYSQHDINLDILVSDPTAYEVDHIIPISISLDDSINNKALCSHRENQEKGNKTPLMAMSSGLIKGSSLKEYELFIKGLKISKKKRDNYLYAKDITRYENMKDFVARNLVDTSYANRLLFNTLNDYFKDNEIDTKVHTVKGSATNRFRKLIKLEKDREKDFSHHAIDALLIASIKKASLYRNILKDFRVDNKDVVFNKNTGEIIEDVKDYDLDASDIKFIREIGDYEVKNYSWMIDTKPNRSVADQTIYSTRYIDGQHKVVKKYKDIYAKKISSKYCPIADDIMNNESDKYLMKKNNPLTWSIVEDVVKNYYEQFKDDSEMIKNEKGLISFKFNPFNLMIEENPDKKIRKYSKHNNGPIVTSLSYLDSTLNSCIDISKNYNVKNKKVVLLQISPYRTDFYLDNGVYKFVTVKYKDVRYSNSDNKYHIDKEWYQSELSRKKISSNSSFLFSLHKNDLISISTGQYKGMYRFIGTKSDDSNIIELNSIDMQSEKRLTPSITSKTENLQKYYCDSLGKMTEVKMSSLKMDF